MGLDVTDDEHRRARGWRWRRRRWRRWRRWWRPWRRYVMERDNCAVKKVSVCCRWVAARSRRDVTWIVDACGAAKNCRSRKPDLVDRDVRERIGNDRGIVDRGTRQHVDASAGGEGIRGVDRFVENRGSVGPGMFRGILEGIRPRRACIIHAERDEL